MVERVIDLGSALEGFGGKIEAAACGLDFEYAIDFKGNGDDNFDPVAVGVCAAWRVVETLPKYSCAFNDLRDAAAHIAKYEHGRYLREVVHDCRD